MTTSDGSPEPLAGPDDPDRDRAPLTRRQFVTGAGILGAGAALGSLVGCASAGGSTAASSDTASGPAAPQMADPGTRLIGKLQKTEMVPHVTKVYDPAKIEYAAFDGEPSRNHFFKPVADEGVKDRDYPPYDAKTFKFLTLSSPSYYPQTYYLFDKDGGSLAKALGSTGYGAVRIIDQGHIKILPNLYTGYYDFAYLPLGPLVEYWSGNESMNQELWKRGDGYVIVAGSSNGGVWLLGPESVKGLADLAGARVGIMNPSYDTEAIFAKALRAQGLAPESVGGNIGITMGAPGRIMNDLMAKKLDAVFSWAIYTERLQQVYHYRVLLPWQEFGYGAKVPNRVLVARRDIVEKHPEIVQTVVQLNHEATLLAQHSSEHVKPLETISREFQAEYMGHLYVQVPDEMPLDAEVGAEHLRDVVAYMDEAGYFREPYAFERLVDLSFTANITA